MPPPTVHPNLWWPWPTWWRTRALDLCLVGCRSRAGYRTTWGPKSRPKRPFSTQSFAIWELKIKLSQQGVSLYFTSNMIHDGPFYGNMESQAQTDIEPGELQCVPQQLGRHFEP